jgi:hypothetical protein
MTSGISRTTDTVLVREGTGGNWRTDSREETSGKD